MRDLKIDSYESAIITNLLTERLERLIVRIDSLANMNSQNKQNADVWSLENERDYIQVLTAKISGEPC